MFRLLALLTALAPCAAAAATFDAIVAEAAADCASADNGVLTVAPDAVTLVDLTGDGVPDQIISAAGFSCSSLASLYGGTGGDRIYLLADGVRGDFSALDWLVTAFGGDKVVLMAVHGGVCGGTGSDPCYQAVVWTAEGWKTTGPGFAE